MKDYPVVIRFPTHWGEMDALGHINHTRFIAWMETARLELFGRIGLACIGKPIVGPILANVNVNYFSPVHYPADMVCGARIPRIGNTSFTMEYAVAHAHSPDEPVAQGTTVIVLYDYEADAKIQMPRPLKEAIAALHGESA